MYVLNGRVMAVVMATLVVTGCETETQKPAPTNTRLAEVQRYDDDGKLLSVGKVGWPSRGELRMQTTLAGSDGVINTGDVTWQERVCKYDPDAVGLPMVESSGGYANLIASIPAATVTTMGWPQAIDGLFCQRAMGSTVVLQDSYVSGVSNAVTQTVTVSHVGDVVTQAGVINLTPTETYAYTDTVAYQRDPSRLFGRIVTGTVVTQPSSGTGLLTAAAYADEFFHLSDGRLSHIVRHSGKGVDNLWLTSDDVLDNRTNYVYLGAILGSIEYGLPPNTTSESFPVYSWHYVIENGVLREQRKLNVYKHVVERWIYENY